MDNDPSGRRILLAALAILLLFAAGAFLPRNPVFDAFFGLEAYRSLGPVTFLAAACLLVVVLTVPAVGPWISRGLSALVRPVPPIARVPALLALSGAAFLIFSSERASGDFGGIVFLTAMGEVYPSNALTSYLQIGAVEISGVGVVGAVRTVAFLAGLVYVIAAVGIGREVFEDRPRRAGLTALLLTAGAATQFYGTIEVYAPLVAGIAVYLYFGLRFLSGRGSRIAAPLALGITFCLHGSAGLLLPSLFLLANEGRLRPFRIRRWFAFGCLFLAPVLTVAGTLYFYTWGGSPPPGGGAIGNFAGAMGQSPLLPLFRTATNVTHRYALLDAEHLIGVLNLYALAAPAGLALLLSVQRFRPDRSTFWVAVCAFFLMVFPIFWNVSYSLRRDWDLFVPAGVPLALLGGAVYLRAQSEDAIRAVALSLFCFAPLVVSLAGPATDSRVYARSMADALAAAARLSQGARRDEPARLADHWREVAKDRDERGFQDLFDLATNLASEGDYAGATRVYRACLDILPDNSLAHSNLGISLYLTGKRQEGVPLIDQAVRLDPENLHAWLTLAKIAVFELRNEDAIRDLEVGIRLGNTQPEVGEALELLAKLHMGRDEEDIARELLRLAETLPGQKGR